MDLGGSLVQFALLNDLIKQLATLGQLQNNAEIVLSVDELDQVDDAGMIHRTEDFNLIDHPEWRNYHYFDTDSKDFQSCPKIAILPPFMSAHIKENFPKRIKTDSVKLYFLV